MSCTLSQSIAHITLDYACFTPAGSIKLTRSSVTAARKDPPAPVVCFCLLPHECQATRDAWRFSRLG